MASIFSLYKEVIPPTACDCCAFASFTSPDARNVITTCASFLRIYNVDFVRSSYESAIRDHETNGEMVRTFSPLVRIHF